jgi:SWI/SNF-related matrix-associated actin-dependent regulator 1 of chromatin subfamily A
MYYIARRAGRTVLADDMGVGKTFQAILFSYMYKTQDGAVLILCPTSLCRNWYRELTKWCTKADANFDSSKEIVLLPTEKSVSRLLNSKSQYFIVSYAIAQRSQALSELIKRRFQILIADESQAVKNEGAKRCASTQALSLGAKRVLLLSGTPGVRPLELFTQFSMVAQHIFPANLQWIAPKYTTFARLNREKTRQMNHRMPFSFVSRWCDPWLEQTFSYHKQWNKMGSARLDELHAIGREFVFLRREAKDVLTDELPPKTRKYITMEVSDEDAQTIGKVMSKMEEAKANHQEYERKKCFMQMYNDLPRIKAEFVKQHVKETIMQTRMQKQKCILCAHHKPMIAMLEEVLQEGGLTLFDPKAKKKGKIRKADDLVDLKQSGEGLTVPKNSDLQLSYIKIDGDTDTDIRQSLSEYFQNTDSCRIAVLSMTAGGVGLNLFKASLVVMTEMYFTPGVLAQAEARAHRLGQENPVEIEYLIANGTLDQALRNIVAKKTKVSSRLLDGREEDEEAKEEAIDETIVDAALAELQQLRKPL